MRYYNSRMRKLIKDSDILFFDANFTDGEYENQFNYGHSSMSQTYNLAKDCGIKRLVFWHHDRSRTDREVKKIVKEYINKGRKEKIIVEPARINKSVIL